MKAISLCCNVKAEVEGRTTKYYVCNKCLRPCDIILKSNSKVQ